jgi:hypothetical protein
MKKILYSFIFINLFVLQNVSAFSFAGFEISFSSLFGSFSNETKQTSYEVTTGDVYITDQGAEAVNQEIINNYYSNLNENQSIENIGLDEIIQPSDTENTDESSSWIEKLFANIFGEKKPTAKEDGLKNTEDKTKQTNQQTSQIGTTQTNQNPPQPQNTSLQNPSGSPSSFSPQPGNGQGQTFGDQTPGQLADPNFKGITNTGPISGNSQGAIGKGIATVFGHLQNKNGVCYQDDQDMQHGGRSASGLYLTGAGRPPIPAVALPQDVQTKIFGGYKDEKGNLIGAGAAVQVMYNGNCKVFPLYETGPAAGPRSKGVVIDLTGSAYDLMEKKQPCRIVSGPPKSSSGQLENVSYAVFKDKRMKPGEVGECANTSN